MSRTISNLVFFTGLAIAPAAFAQGTVYGPNPANASRLLEVDLSPTKRGNYTRSSLADEYRLRNAIVTGTTPGGTAFRGDAGYTDSRDFRAGLGSDSSFNFRRDSFSSGLGGMGFRGTDALQYQFAYTTGNLGVTNRRTNEKADSLSKVRSELLQQTSATDDRFLRGGWTQSAPDFGTLRSAASYTATRSLNPAIVAARTTSVGTEEIVASPLLGLRTQITGKAWFQQKEDERNRARSPSAAAQAVNQPDSKPEVAVNTAYDTLKQRLDQFAGPDSRRTTPPDQPATDTPATPPGVTPATTPGATPTTPDTPTGPSSAWERRMDDLRTMLDRRMGLTPEPARTGPAAAQPGDEPAREDPTKPDTRKTRAWLDDETVAILRQGAADVSVYVEGLPRDFYAEHMLAGQTFMGSERYFDAEERFARALSFKQGDPTAMAARVNAELGAGMLVSAAINLRELFERHPEVIPLRFTGATIPSRARQDALVKLLRGNIDQAKNQVASVTRESAFLLAYLGWQRADKAMVSEGLEFIRLDLTRRADPEDRLMDLLATLWLEDAKAPADAK